MKSKIIVFLLTLITILLFFLLRNFDVFEDISNKEVIKDPLVNSKTSQLNDNVQNTEHLNVTNIVSNESILSLDAIDDLYITSTLYYSDEKLVLKEIVANNLEEIDETATVSPSDEKYIPSYIYFQDGSLMFAYYTFNDYKYAEFFNQKGDVIDELNFLNKLDQYLFYDKGCLEIYTSEGSAYASKLVVLNPDYHGFIKLNDDKTTGITATLSEDDFCFENTSSFDFISIYKTNKWMNYRLVNDTDIRDLKIHEEY